MGVVLANGQQEQLTQTAYCRGSQPPMVLPPLGGGLGFLHWHSHVTHLRLRLLLGHSNIHLLLLQPAQQ